MAHKTNYKDALFEQRKYRMQNNPDGTVTPIDETDYTQEGDRVGALELNEIGEALNALEQEMGKRELQTYTALSQLSLEAPVTLSQLITAMPDGSYAAIDCNGTSVVSDIPSGSAAGSLEVVKVGTSGSAKYTNTSNGQVYFGGNGQWYAVLVDEMILDTMEEIDANTDSGKVAGALAVKELSSDLKFPDGTGFYPDVQNGQRGYNTDPARGADTFSPFREEIILGERLIRSGLTATTTINMADYCEDISKVTIDNFLFTITNINAYCWSWGHPSDTHGPDTNNNFSPVTGSYDSISGILTVTISAPTYGSGEYGQTGGGSCRITPTVNVYFLGDKK